MALARVRAGEYGVKAMHGVMPAGSVVCRSDRAMARPMAASAPRPSPVRARALARPLTRRRIACGLRGARSMPASAAWSASAYRPA